MPKLIVYHVTGADEIARYLPHPDTFASQVHTLEKQFASIAAREEELEKANKSESQREELARVRDQKAEKGALLLNLQHVIARIREGLEQAPAEVITKVEYRFHPFTVKERRQAVRAATKGEGKERFFDQDEYRTELVGLCVDNLKELFPNHEPDSLPWSLVELLGNTIVGASEASLEAVDFTLSPRQT
jgi:hypothetical protein